MVVAVSYLQSGFTANLDQPREHVGIEHPETVK
jgi:hypothetical protein